VLVRLGCEREASVQGVELGTFFQKRRPGAKLLGTSQRDVPGFGPFPQEEVYSGSFPTTTRRGVPPVLPLSRRRAIRGGNEGAPKKDIFFLTSREGLRHAAITRMVLLVCTILNILSCT